MTTFKARTRADSNGHGPRDRAVRAIAASTITPATVRWLWRGWLPLRMVSLLVGLPGLGKTTLAALLAADATRGTLDGAFLGQPVDVLFVTFEDALAETLVPRLMAADADLDRVQFLTCAEESGVLDLTRHLGDIDALAEQHAARLLFIDPLVAALPAGDIDTHRDASVRSVLGPVAALAERRDLAVLATMHFSKSASNALLGVGGSIAFAAAARSILVFGADPGDERGEDGPARVLGHRKSSVGRRQRSRQVWIQPAIAVAADIAIDTAVAVIGDEVDVDADALVQVGNAKTTPRVQAQRFLRDLLRDGPHTASEVFSLGEDAGISANTIRRAKADLGVEAYQEAGKWWWRLPDDIADEPEDET